MVHCCDGRKCTKHAETTGEPPAKKFCVQLAEKPSKFTITFNGTNGANGAKGGNSTYGSSGNEEKAKAVKRVAPQDDLSAKIHPRHRFW